MINLLIYMYLLPAGKIHAHRARQKPSPIYSFLDKDYPLLIKMAIRSTKFENLTTGNQASFYNIHLCWFAYL